MMLFIIYILSLPLCSLIEARP